jgi:hypothetical protein
LVDAQGSRYTGSTGKQAAIKIDEGSRRYIQTNGISHSTSWVDDVLEKLYCTTAYNVFDGLEKILMTARSQDTLRATHSPPEIRDMTTRVPGGF